MQSDRPGPQLDPPSRVGGVLALAIGVVALVGWAFDVAALKSVGPGWTSMKVNTALCFVSMGLALLVRPPRLARAGALATGIISVLTLSEYLFGWDLGIDQCLFREPPGAVGTSHPGRMAPDTAFCFASMAVASWLARSPLAKKRKWVASVILGSLVTLLALAALLAAFVPGLRLHGWWGYTNMAAPTAGVFAVLGAATVRTAWREALGPGLVEFSSHLWRMAACVAALVVAVALYARSEGAILHAHELRHRSFLLADELRQSGDDLTRMVRTYVVTGDPVYKRHFQDILDIRDGKKPRPVDYWKPYWDLKVGDGPGPAGAGRAVPLLELMRQAGFTDEEFRKLAEAKANSDGLTIPEFEAMRLVESGGPEAEANQAKARGMLYDAQYHQAKVAVMGPIREFLGLVDARTRGAVVAAENSATLFRYLFAASAFALVLVLWRAYVALHAVIGGAVDDVHAHLALLGSGDFSAPIVVGDGLQNSVLGWLAVTQGKLGDAERERRHAEAEIRQLNATLEARVTERTAQLEAANKELEAFSYSVSHDLRSPLRAIDGYSRMLREDYERTLEPEAQRMLGVVSAETQRMGQLIDDLLEFSRRGRHKLEIAPIDMAALARAAFEVEAAAVPTRALKLDLKPLLAAHGDRTVLRLVWGNLLSNAIKFSAHREPAVIEIESHRGDGESIYSVRDNGVGFDMKYADKLFGVFQRLHSAAEFKGTGVGLALVQRIIHRHGGRVWAEAKVDEGATFSFSLPDA